MANDWQEFEAALTEIATAFENDPQGFLDAAQQAIMDARNQ
jgi:hypothetical protein